MTKSSNRRRVRAVSARRVSAAGSLLTSGRNEDAIAELLEAAKVNPQEPDILNDLGVAYLRTGRLSEAILWLRRSDAVRPAGRTQYNLGLAFEISGDTESSFNAFRRAAQLSPDFAPASARYGDLLWELGRRREAASEFRRAAETSADPAMRRLCTAMALNGQGRPQEAEQELREAVSNGECGHKAHMLLGRLLQETGRFEEAGASFDRVIAMVPSLADAYYALFSTRRVTEADRPTIARILSQLEPRAGTVAYAPDRQKMTLHFALGKAFDDLEDYASAMSHFNEANAIRCRLHPFNRSLVERDVDRIIRRFTPEFFATHSDLGIADPTPILVFGMPRSGTTLLERTLTCHPKVGGRGELDFWLKRGPALMSAGPDALVSAATQLRFDYVGLLRSGAPEVHRVTDKMPFNFFWAGLVHVLFPNATLLHSRRSAVDTCLSIYTTLAGNPWGFGGSQQDLVWYYQQYERLMAHWRKVIPSNRLFDVDYETLVREPEASIRNIIAYCDLEWNDACLRPESNRDSILTASQWQARQPIYQSSLGRAQNYEPWLSELKALVRDVSSQVSAPQIQSIHSGV